jgi:hypothetical protein
VPTSAVAHANSPPHVVARAIVEIAIATTGAVFVAWAIAANQRWFDRHFLPAYFVSRHAYVQETIRHRVFDDSGLPVVRVVLDGRWRIPGDGHPDARAARAIAMAVAARVRER